MALVESSGNPLAIGDHGRARGILQIHPGVVQDVNRIAGTRYRHQDAHDPKVAVFMATVYLGHYCPGGSAEEMARVWHCGPRGRNRAHGARYWGKVRRQLK